VEQNAELQKRDLLRLRKCPPPPPPSGPPNGLELANVIQGEERQIMPALAKYATKPRIDYSSLLAFAPSTNMSSTARRSDQTSEKKKSKNKNN
jgi:hypothetical protein